MKKFKNWVIGGIENKIFNVVVLNVLLIIIVYGVILFFQSKSLTTVLTKATEEQKKDISTITTMTMDAVVDSGLTKQTLLEGYVADSTFSSLEGHVRMIVDYAEKLYESPDEYPRIVQKSPDQMKPGVLAPQMVLPEDVDLSNPEIEDEAGLVGNLGDMLTSVYDSTELSACFITTESGITLIADDRPEEKLDENGNGIRIDGRTRPWYVGAIKNRDVYFTDVEVDYFTGQIGIECSMPVFKDGKIVAIVGADLFLDSMSESIKASAGSDGFAFIISQKGQVIFSPMEEGSLKVESTDVAKDLRENESESFASFVTEALEKNTEVCEVVVDGKSYYMCAARLETTGWAVVNAVEKEVTEQPTIMLQEEYQKSISKASEEIDNKNKKYRTIILLVLAGVLLLSNIGALVIAKRIVKPLNKMSKKVQDISGDNLDFEVVDDYKTGDEIQVLAESFSDLSERTKKYIAENMRITAEKERIGAELNVATQIQADMLPRIFPAFPERREFDLFASMDPAKEVGGDFYDFFLLDDDHLVMVMADVSGKGVPAALFMVIAKTLIKNRAQMGGTPAEILRDVNNQLCEGNEAELFVTVWLAILQISTGEGMAANAGHEHPALKRRGGQYELITYRHSPALATMPNIKFKEHEFKLNPGDSLFVYTDGVAEATDANDELFGGDRLLEALNAEPDAPCKKILENMQKKILEFVGDAPQFDDITMLSLNYIGSGEVDG